MIHTLDFLRSVFSTFWLDELNLNVKIQDLSHFVLFWSGHHWSKTADIQLLFCDRYDLYSYWYWPYVAKSKSRVKYNATFHKWKLHSNLPKICETVVGFLVFTVCVNKATWLHLKHEVLISTLNSCVITVKLLHASQVRPSIYSLISSSPG